MTNRSLTMDSNRTFVVGEDPGGVIAEALAVATASGDVEAALAPDGGGVHVQGVATIKRIWSREEIPMQCEADTPLDPEAQELWALYRERDRTHRAAATVITGHELRALVQRAIGLRGG